jgi:DNA-binding CsgD family transcriptional regulator
VAESPIDHIPVGGFVLVFERTRNMRAAKRRWTPSEQRLLDEMLAAGKTAAEIGLILDRRAEAVWARIHRLKLKGELPGPPYVARREQVNVEV